MRGKQGKRFLVGLACLARLFRVRQLAVEDSNQPAVGPAFRRKRANVVLVIGGNVEKPPDA